MKYYPGDIIEILNISSNSLESIKNSYEGTKNPTKDIIGMRYILDEVFEDLYNLHPEMELRLKGWNHGGNTCNYFGKSQVRLYHRPLKNWIKYLFRR